MKKQCTYIWICLKRLQSDQKRSHHRWHSKTIRYFTLWLSLSIRYLLKVGGCSPAGPLYWWSWTQWVIKIFKGPLHFLISSPNETNYNQTKWSLHIIITIIWCGKVGFDVEQSPFSTLPYPSLWWLKFFKTFFTAF